MDKSPDRIERKVNPRTVARWKVETDNAKTWYIKQTWMDSKSDSIDWAINAVMDAMRDNAKWIKITRTL